MRWILQRATACIRILPSTSPAFSVPAQRWARGRRQGADLPSHVLQSVAVGLPPKPYALAASTLLEEEAPGAPWMICGRAPISARCSGRRSRAAAIFASASRMRRSAQGRATSRLVEEAVRIVRDTARSRPRRTRCGRRWLHRPEAAR